MVGFICFSPTFVLKVKRLNFLCLLLFTYFSPTFHLLFHLLSPTFHLLSIVLQFLGKLFAFGLGWHCETLFTYFSPTFHLLFTYFSPTFTYFSPKKCFWPCFWWKLSAFHLNFHQNKCFWPTFHLLFTHFSPTFHLLSFDTTAWVKALPGLWFLFFFLLFPYFVGCGQSRWSFFHQLLASFLLWHVNKENWWFHLVFTYFSLIFCVEFN